MKSLEETFRQSKRSHTFIEFISPVRNTREPKVETRTSERDKTQPQALPVQGGPKPAIPATTEGLQGLREDWLTSNMALPGQEDGSAQKRGRSKPERQITIANYTPFLESLKESFRETKSPVARRYDAGSKRGTSATKLASVLAACLAAMILIGTLIYTAAVNYSTSGKLSTVMQPGSTGTPVAGNPPDAGQTTQAATLPAPDPASAPKLTFDISAAANGSTNSDRLTKATQGLESLDKKGQFDFNALSQTFAHMVGGLAHKVNNEQTQHNQADTPSSRNAQLSLISTLPNPEPPPSIAGHDANPATYLEPVRGSQQSLQRSDFKGVYQSAAEAEALNPSALPALELTQSPLAAGGNPGAAEAAAFAAITHGGKAVFELQHFHASPIGLHPARIVITATTLEFIPEAPCETGAFTIPLASIISVRMGQSASEPYLLNITFADFRNGRDGRSNGQLSFRDSSSRLRKPNAAQISSQLSPAQEMALFTAIRHVVLAEKEAR